MYAMNEILVVSQAEKDWHGILVCPLVPLVLLDCPGTLAREISDLAAWISAVYDSNPLGMQAPLCKTNEAHVPHSFKSMVSGWMTNLMRTNKRWFIVMKFPEFWTYKTLLSGL